MAFQNTGNQVSGQHSRRVGRRGSGEDIVHDQNKADSVGC